MGNTIRSLIKVIDGPTEEKKRFIKENKDIKFENYAKEPEEFSFSVSNKDEAARQEILKSMIEACENSCGYFAYSADLSKLKEKFTDEQIETGKRMIINELKFGYSSWYQWRKDNWGTDKEGETIFATEDLIEIETNWCPPMKIFEKMAERYPNLVMEIFIASEFIEEQTCLVKICNGKITEVKYPENLSDEAVNIYFEVTGERDYWECINGNWRPITTHNEN